MISGLHCISHWHGGVWTAGMETCYGSFQQMQVSSWRCFSKWISRISTYVFFGNVLIFNCCVLNYFSFFQDYLWETSKCFHRGAGHSVLPAGWRDITKHPLLRLQYWLLLNNITRANILFSWKIIVQKSNSLHTM